VIKISNKIKLPRKIKKQQRKQKLKEIKNFSGSKGKLYFNQNKGIWMFIYKKPQLIFTTNKEKNEISH